MISYTQENSTVTEDARNSIVLEETSFLKEPKCNNPVTHLQNETLYKKRISSQVMVVVEWVTNEYRKCYFPQMGSYPFETQTSVSFLSDKEGPLVLHSIYFSKPTAKDANQNVSDQPECSNYIYQMKRAANILYGRIKNKSIFAAMMVSKKLCSLYKCMKYKCSFTCDNLFQFKKHCSWHMKRLPGEKLLCAYCHGIFSDEHELCDHTTNNHLFSDYQCSYCFYRTCCTSNIIIHQLMTHDQESIFQMFKSPLISSNLIKQAPPKRNRVILPYICSYLDCNLKFYTPVAFQVHIQNHFNGIHACTCSYCQTEFCIGNLVTHYKKHSINIYQCLYCIFGSDTEEDMRVHLCILHSGDMPRAVKRENQQPILYNREHELLDDLKECNFDDQGVVSSYLLDYSLTCRLTENVLARGIKNYCHSKNMPSSIQVDYPQTATSPGNISNRIKKNTLKNPIVLNENACLKTVDINCPRRTFPKTSPSLSFEVNKHFKRTGEKIKISQPPKKVKVNNVIPLRNS